MEHDSSVHDLQLGRVLIERGVVTEAAMRETIALQRQMEQQQLPAIPRLGELLVQKGFATGDQIRDALSVQNRKILFCPRCQHHVNVDLRPDVLIYRCGRCEIALVEPPSGQEIKVVESTIMFVIRDPLPAEVQERLQDANSKFGKYILVKELGRGGVGIVHKAWDTYLGQFVALKRLKTIAAGARRETVREAHIASLLKEARSAIRLRHPHIATVYDVGRIGREFYMSLEYLEGRTLGRHLAEAREVENKVSPFYDQPKKYLRCVRDVSRALHYAHTRPAPVIHCDLKPSNIIIDTTGRAYVLDFGLARNLRGLQEEPTGAVSGTPSYMAPEQASGHTEDIDARTDVYGIGTVLYELLTGRPPFLGSVQTVLHKALSELPERPEEVLALSAPSSQKIPEGLEEICLRCLEKDRSLRFQTAHQVADAIERIIKGDTGRIRSAPGALTPSPKPVPQAITRREPVSAPAAALPPRAPRLFMFGVGALGSAVAFAAVMMIANLWKRDETAARPEPHSIERLLAHAAVFRSDLAVRESAEMQRSGDARLAAELAPLQEEFRWMELSRSRVIDAIDKSQPRIRLATFHTRTGSLSNAELLKATEAGLFAFVDGQMQEFTWRQITPAQILDLAAQALPNPRPEDALGLALFARRAGLQDRAQSLFAALNGTALEAAAKRYQP